MWNLGFSLAKWKTDQMIGVRGHVILTAPVYPRGSVCLRELFELLLKSSPERRKRPQQGGSGV